VAEVAQLAAAAAAAVPTVFEGAANTVAILVLLAEFLMLRSALLRAQVRIYAVQSLLVSVLAGVVAFGRDIPELYVLAGVSFALKVVIVPMVILRLMRNAGTEIAGSGVLGVASEVMVSLGVAGFGSSPSARWMSVRTCSRRRRSDCPLRWCWWRSC
jgi:hydrogenase-4 component E